MHRKYELPGLGEVRDLFDAETVYRFVTMREESRINHEGVRYVLNQIWFNPRVATLGPDAGFSSHRNGLNWTDEARAAADAETRTKNDIVLEHLIPLKQVYSLLALSESPSETLEILRRNILVAIVSNREDKLISASGLKTLNPFTDEPIRRWYDVGVFPFGPRYLGEVVR